MLKKFIGIMLLAVFVLSFSSCGESKKYKFNANNGFCVEEDYHGDAHLYWIKKNKVATLNLYNGELDYDYQDIPQDIDKNNIVNFISPWRCVVKGKDEFIIYLFGDNESLRLPSNIPDKNYTAIFNINDRFLLDIDVFFIMATLSGKELTLYSVNDESNICLTQMKKYTLDKKYDSAFHLGGQIIGLVKGNEIDFFNLELSDTIDDFSDLPDHITLDKQYDAYVGGPSLGSDSLLCIEGNRAKTYLIKRGVFTYYFGGEEVSWTF